MCLWIPSHLLWRLVPLFTHSGLLTATTLSSKAVISLPPYLAPRNASYFSPGLRPKRVESLVCVKCNTPAMPATRAFCEGASLPLSHPPILAKIHALILSSLFLKILILVLLLRHIPTPMLDCIAHFSASAMYAALEKHAVLCYGEDQMVTRGDCKRVWWLDSTHHSRIDHLTTQKAQFYCIR